MTGEPATFDLGGLANDIRRVADRLRSLSAGQLAAPAPRFGSRTDAGRKAAQALADAAQGFEHSGAAESPGWRALPALSDFAVGDTVAVTGRDLIVAATGTRRNQQVWTRVGRRAAADVLSELGELLTDVRRVL